MHFLKHSCLKNFTPFCNCWSCTNRYQIHFPFASFESHLSCLILCWYCQVRGHDSFEYSKGPLLYWFYATKHKFSLSVNFQTQKVESFYFYVVIFICKRNTGGKTFMKDRWGNRSLMKKVSAVYKRFSFIYQILELTEINFNKSRKPSTEKLLQQNYLHWNLLVASTNAAASEANTIITCTAGEKTQPKQRW